MIEVGNIVTLENDVEYLILEELTHEDKKYVYTVRTLEDETPTDEFVIYEVMDVEGDAYLKDIDNKELYDELIEEFKDIVADKILNGDLDEMEALIDDYEEGEAA
ncbi:MAG: DUF1292 domain-containing protein [Bacilli bacterium]|nr:DUF1292 domain-containing protein [Bacilli bacterium]